MFNGYDFAHDKHPMTGYLLSAAVGVAVIAAAVFAVFAVVRVVQSHRDSGGDGAEAGAPA